MSRLTQTPSQTVGPFFSIGMPCDPYGVPVNDEADGERIRIEGTVFDGAGSPIDDALIEVWQADAAGRYGAPGFIGFRRAATGADGSYALETVKPGPVDATGGGRPAPHLNIAIFARGMLLHAFTRMYFSDDDPAGRDPVLMRVDPARVETLVARRSERDGRGVYGWDIHLQGDRETVFFDA